MNTYFYFHAGSDNHGCEAIVRSTAQLLSVKPILLSDSPEMDAKYSIDQIADVRPKSAYQFSVIEKAKMKLGSDQVGYTIKGIHEAKDFEKGSVAFSIGGDNYCYGDAYNWHLAELNYALHKRKVKTVLWGCSIEPSSVTDEMKKDFARYDYIIARESISYNFLKEINENTFYACDPAFTLELQECNLPDNFIPGKTVGINVSPLIQKKEQVEGITIENYRILIDYILNETEYNIALIPHVVSEDNDDRLPLRKLYDYAFDKSRVCLIEDHNCMELKWIISRCAFFIGARTHATIAAYSTYVPTLVVGYSTKAVGIAKDLFENEENYVLPVQELASPNQLLNAFKWLQFEADTVKSHLRNLMPDYKASIINIAEEVLNYK